MSPRLELAIVLGFTALVVLLIIGLAVWILRGYGKRPAPREEVEQGIYKIFGMDEVDQRVAQAFRWPWRPPIDPVRGPVRESFRLFLEGGEDYRG